MCPLRIARIPGRGVPNLDDSVVASEGEETAVGTESHAGTATGFESVSGSGGLSVPRSLPSCRRRTRRVMAIGAEDDTGHQIGMAKEAANFSAASDGPEANGLIGTCRGEVRPSGLKATP